MAGQVEKTSKKSKVMEKLKRSGSSKSSQKKVTQQKLVITTTAHGHVMGVEAELMVQKMKIVSRSPTAKPPSGGHEGSHNDDPY